MLRGWCAKHAFYHGAASLLHAPMFVYLAYFYVIHAVILLSILFLLWVNNIPLQRHTTVHITSHPFVCPSTSSWERCCYWHLRAKISSSTCVHFLKKDYLSYFMCYQHLAYINVCASRACLVPVDARREHRIPKQPTYMCVRHGCAWCLWMVEKSIGSLKSLHVCVCVSWVCLVPVDGRREHRIPIDCCEPPQDSYRDHRVCPLDPCRSLCASIRSLSIIVSLHRIPTDRCEPPQDLYGSL